MSRGPEEVSRLTENTYRVSLGRQGAGFEAGTGNPGASVVVVVGSAGGAQRATRPATTNLGVVGGVGVCAVRRGPDFLPTFSLGSGAAMARLLAVSSPRPERRA
ncbi:hypothetical protein TREES_T100020600 [Tupaia chinensis]|uniref:Uncharacterized protein n=1 Tax=Tupaia chinensis TaxID=246437 RepID=L9KUN7_TUPCH|nr:hypothetical protein TREES_T100020600 [Tupaia chinensis]